MTVSPKPSQSDCADYLHWFELAATEWMCQFQPSQLCEEENALLREVERLVLLPRKGNREDQIQSLFDDFSSFASSKQQLGEMYVRAALFITRSACAGMNGADQVGYDPGQDFAIAERFLNTARGNFSDSTHQLATVAWMCGCLKLLRGGKILGLLTLEESIHLYREKLNTRRAGLNDESARWYTQHIELLTRLKAQASAAEMTGASYY